MPSSHPPHGRHGLVVAAAAALALALTPVVQDKTAPYPRHGDYAGKKACLDCHEDEGDKIERGVHQPVIHSAQLQECETCHGPGKKHAENVDNDPALITHPHKLENTTALCARCHADQIREHGGDLKGFFTAGKKCTSCHKVHEPRPSTPHVGVRFGKRADTLTQGRPTGASKCVECHPARSTLLEGTGHARLSAKTDPKGCETCHGNGSLHVETGGLARLITRPDRAADGVATCRTCHETVDATEFHWKGKHKPLLSDGLTCTTCHTVHRGRTTDPGEGGGGDGDATAAATNATCATCHAPALDVLRGTIHEALGGPDTPLAKGCGSCHEGGLAHANNAGRPSLIQSMRGTDAATQSKTCAQCHEDDAAMHRSRSGSHHKNQVTCLSCHSPAAPRGKVREDASQKCTTCHRAVAAEFALPNHHPVPEGGMHCVDCHDPHDARPRLRDRQLREERCVSCHKEYRGPFVFAHQASRTQGCVTCHSPHGSTNRRMLKQATSQQNCLQCHGDFPSFHDQTSGAVFTNCLKCHTEVHGSNHSRFLFR